ncbi:17201_t:CDS:1, partial [Acaulospora morrowiae]
MKELNKTFKQIAIAMTNDSDLFEYDNEYETETYNNTEIIDLDNNQLDIINSIDLTSTLLSNNNIGNLNQEKEIEIEHGDIEFNVDELVENFIEK